MTRYSKKFEMVKSSSTRILYTLKALLRKNWFYFFLSSSDIAQFQHLLGCLTMDINSSLITFLNPLCFFKFTLPSQKPDNTNSIRIIFIKIVIKINTFKIYLKNTRFIIWKYNIHRICIKVEYIFVWVQSSKMLFHLRTKQ